MTNAKTATKKLLSVVLCLAMVLPMLFATGISHRLSIFDSVVPEVQAATVESHKVYTIAYDLDGGTMPSTYYTPAGEYTANDPILLPTPTKVGYKFAGWVVVKADASDCNWEDSISSKETNIGNGYYGNVTLVAQWTAVDVEVNVSLYLQDTWSDDYILLTRYIDHQPTGTVIDIIDYVANMHEEGAYYFEEAFVDGKAEAVDTVTVSADGSTHIQLYFILDKHTVTVNYVTPEGVEAPASYVGDFRYGQDFEIKSPEVDGYIASSPFFSGKMDKEDIEATITYTQGNSITVNYKYADDSIAYESVTKTFAYGTEYSIASPEIEGYTPSLSVVEGIIGEADITVDVIYEPNKHTVTVFYVYADGTAAAAPYVAALDFGSVYNIKSADVAGYTASSAYVSGTVNGNKEITVTYTPNTYTVIFKNYDGKELSVQSVTYGNAATAPENPVRPNDNNYSYEFTGWSADFSNVTCDMIITPEYIATGISDDKEVDNSFFGKIKAFFLRIINFFKDLFVIT